MKDDPLDWWRASIAGFHPPASPSDPQVGYFKRKLVRGGPWVPAAIFWAGPRDDDGNLIGDEKLVCIVNGVARDPVDEWTYLLGQPITEEEYRYLCDLRAYAKAHDSAEPLAEPHKAIDRLTAPIPTFKKRKRT